MALSDSAVSELLDAFRAGDGVDLVRESVRLVLQELIEVEAAQVIGAGRYERTPERVAERNGSRPRELMTRAGTVELAIPMLRVGSFFPSVLEARRRIDQALYAVITGDRPGARDRRERREARERAEGEPTESPGRNRDLQVRGVADLCRSR